MKKETIQNAMMIQYLVRLDQHISHSQLRLRENGYENSDLFIKLNEAVTEIEKFDIALSKPSKIL